MKRLTLGVLALAASLLLAADFSQAASVSSYPAGALANGVATSRHNLGSLGRVIRSTGTTEICVFCHTPHHANQTNGLAPLWNRGTQTPGSYTAYGTTLGGSTISTVGGASLACLSCHDGVTTFDTLVNAPGKGGINPGGFDLNWKFDMPSSQPGLTPNTFIDHFSAPSCLPCHNHSAADLGGQISRFIIGQDLTNDHPVSVPYTVGRASLRPTNTLISGIDLTSNLAASAPTAFGGNLAQNRWAIKGRISDTATIADLLRGGNVECSSCHDPHFRNLSWDEAEPTWVDPAVNVTNWCNNNPEECSDGNFLRRVGGNTGSGLCRTCHEK